MNILEWKHKLHGQPYRGGEGGGGGGGDGMTDATREALGSYQAANGIAPGSVSVSAAELSAANAAAGGGTVTGGDYYSDVNNVDLDTDPAADADLAAGLNPGLNPTAPASTPQDIAKSMGWTYDAETGKFSGRNEFGKLYDATYAKAGPLGLALPGGALFGTLNKFGAFDYDPATRSYNWAGDTPQRGEGASDSGAQAEFIAALSNAVGGGNVGSTGDSIDDILQGALNHDPTKTAQYAWNRWLDTDLPGLETSRDRLNTAAQDNWTAQKGFATDVMKGMDEWKANELPWLRNARDTLWADARSTADRINADADGSDANFRSYFDPVYGQMRDQVARYNNADFRQGYIDQSMADIQQQLQSAQGQDQRRRMAMGVNPNSGAFTSPGFGVNAAAAKANAANKMRLALDDKYTTGLSTLGEMGQYASNFGLENAKVKAAARKTAYDTTANAGEFGLNVGKQTQAYGDWLTNATNAASSAWGKGLTGLSTAGDFGLNVAKQGLNAANTVGSILDSRTNADANTVAAQTGRMNAQTNATKVANDSNSDDLAGLGSALGWAFENRDALSDWWKSL